MKKSFVYLLTNERRSILYIEVTADLHRRIVEHKSEKGSVFTKKYNLKVLIYFEEFTAIDQAIAREKQLKNWHKEWKWNLIKGVNPNLEDLFDQIKL